MAYDEFNANGEGYQRMIDASAAQRVGTSDEIAEAAAFLLGEHARFITGTDLLIDGGVIASIRTGEYQLGKAVVFPLVCVLPATIRINIPRNLHLFRGIFVSLPQKT